MQESPATPATVRVLVTYCWEDTAFAQQLGQDLAATGATCWFAGVGQDQAGDLGALNRTLAEGDYLVVVLTPDALASAVLQAEINAALLLVWQGQMRGVLPVIAAACDVADFPPIWNSLQYFDATGDYQEALKSVRTTMGLPATVPAPPKRSIRTLSRRTLVVGGLGAASVVAVGASALWISQARNGTVGLTQTPMPVWTFRMGALVRDVAAAKGVVAAGDAKGKVIALTERTGASLWTATLGAGVTTIAVTATSVLVGTEDGRLSALAAATGAEQWHFKTGGAVRSRPALDGNTICFGSDDGTLYAVDDQKGTLLWKHQTSTLYGAREVRSSPAVADGMVYVGAADATIYCLHLDTGRLAWTFKTTGRINAPVTVAQGIVYAGSLDQNVYAIDSKTRALQWKTALAGAINQAPQVAQGRVYVGSVDHGVYAMDAATGHLQWQFTTGDAVDAGPVIQGSLVYANSNDATLYALDASSGTVRWQTQTDIPSGHVVMDGSHLYVGTASGRVLAFRLP